MVMPEGVFPAKGNWHREDRLSPTPANYSPGDGRQIVPVQLGSWSSAGPARSQGNCLPLWPAHVALCAGICISFYLGPCFLLTWRKFNGLPWTSYTFGKQRHSLSERWATPVYRKGHFNMVIRELHSEFQLCTWKWHPGGLSHHNVLVDFQSIISMHRLGLCYWMDCTRPLNYEAVTLDLKYFDNPQGSAWIEVKFVSAWQILLTC